LSVISITNSSGTVVEKFKYDAHGNYEVVLGSALIENKVFYNAIRFEKEIGLYNNRARFYDPIHGSFIQRDPLGYVDGANPYLYSRGSSINFKDPLGLETEGEWVQKTVDDLNAKLAKSGSKLKYKNWEEIKNEKKWENNREILKQIYNMYSDFYKSNNKLEWAGMAKLGGNLIYHEAYMNKLQGIAFSEDMLNDLGDIGKDIFRDLGWQHKAYVEKGLSEMKSLNEDKSISHNILDNWQMIDEGDMKGNVGLLRREQKDIIGKGLVDLEKKYFVGGKMFPISMTLQNPMSENVIKNIEDKWTNGHVGSGWKDYTKFKETKYKLTDDDKFFTWMTKMGQKNINRQMDYFPNYNEFNTRWTWMKESMLPTWEKNKNKDFTQKAIANEIK